MKKIKYRLFTLSFGLILIYGSDLKAQSDYFLKDEEYTCGGILSGRPHGPNHHGTYHYIGVYGGDPEIFVNEYNSGRKKNDKFIFLSEFKYTNFNGRWNRYYLIPKNLVGKINYKILPSGEVECEDTSYEKTLSTNDLKVLSGFLEKYPNSTRKNEIQSKISAIENENLVAENNRILEAKRAEEELNIKLKKEREAAIVQEKRRLANGTSFKDPRDGKVYQIVTIGKQVWFAQNLAYQTNASKDNYRNFVGHGYFYTQNDAKKACPTGWKLPSKSDWNDMFEQVWTDIYDKEAMNMTGYRLKTKSGWGEGFSIGGGFNGSNESGFNAVPDAIEDSRYDYNFKGQYAYWWTSSNIADGCIYSGTKYECAYYVTLCSQMYNDKPVLYYHNSKLTSYHSIRCIKD